jgi:plastocyanin
MRDHENGWTPLQRRPVPVGRLIVVALLCASIVAGCGSGTKKESSGAGGMGETTAAAPGPAQQSAKVQIASFMFVPGSTVVKAGGSVTFTNQDKAPHTATSDSKGQFDTDTLRVGQSKTIKFDRPGTYTYYCVFHRFMTGKVVVE